MISMSILSNPHDNREALSPAAQALKDKCILDAGAVLARICAELDAARAEVAA